MTLTDVDTFAQQWQAWHQEHERVRADRHGFLAITGLHWLTGEPQRFPDAPGEWWTGPEGVVVRLAEGEELLVDGQPVHGEHSFGVIPERGGLTAGFGDAVVEVARRGGPHAAYPGTPAYPADPRWAVTGRYVPFDEPRPTTVGAVVEGLQHVYDAAGRIEFALDGQPLSLTAFNGHAPGSLFVLFTDETSGVTTYAADRSLQV